MNLNKCNVASVTNFGHCYVILHDPRWWNKHPAHQHPAHCPLQVGVPSMTHLFGAHQSALLWIFDWFMITLRGSSFIVGIGTYVKRSGSHNSVSSDGSMHFIVGSAVLASPAISLWEREIVQSSMIIARYYWCWQMTHPPQCLYIYNEKYSQYYFNKSHNVSSRHTLMPE